MIDVLKARSTTPGCHERVHLNSAGAALMSEGVLAAQVGMLNLEAEIGGYEAADEMQSQIDGIHHSVAALLHTSADHIALVDSATTAWNLAFHSIPLEPGDQVLTAEVEYGANYVGLLKAAKDHGIEIVVVPSDADGVLDVDALQARIGPRTKLISITHVPTNGGLINPAAEIGAVATEHQVPYLLDACQSAGQLQLDVDELQCDFLVASGRKWLRGPRGTGFLYASPTILTTTEPPIIDHDGAPWVAPDRYELRADARRFETWENNYAALLGLGVAIDEALALGLDVIEYHVTTMAELLRTKLDDAGLETFDLGRAKSGLVTTVVPGMEAAEVKDALRAEDINVSVSAPGSTLLDFVRRDLPSLVRISPHYYNTEHELDVAVAALAALAR
ncbi:MAG: aminotransferase class V-fold PLP-dependent enzyme [Acidimicrobiales bacterium]|nr:aminotransferase class V-fold PLP-dependent enzyme [Acidimicrobiales bacterium]